MRTKNVSQDSILTEEEQKKCGVGTPNACFALLMGPTTKGKIACGFVVNPEVAQMAGIRLGWRPPPTPEGRDNPICVKGMLNNTTKD